VRPDRIVGVPATFDQDLCRARRREDLTVQQRVPEPSIEALAGAVFPSDPDAMKTVLAPLFDLVTSGGPREA
jgi:hypothetical protein